MVLSCLITCLTMNRNGLSISGILLFASSLTGALFGPLHLRASDPVSFELDVQPILTAAGCNSGPCHGKQRGQNGFQLSLLGFDSDFDHAAITREGRGRRVFPAAPEQSLLLLKASGELPHGGGIRITKGSRNYQILSDWLKQGQKRRVPGETELESISLNRTDELLRPGETRALTVTAHYRDGTTRDVTSVSTFQSNDPAIVAVDASGQMVAGELPGETAIMARYMNVIEVCHVAIPRGEPVDAAVYEQLPRHNYIDELIWRKLERLHVTPSEPADDATFLRRVYTDIIGRLPTADEARQFLMDTAADKRRRLIDTLLERPEYAEFMANKWADLLRTNPYRVGIKTTLNYDHWIRQQFRDNVPYDQFVRELITATGSTFRHGAVTLFRDRRSPDEMTTLVTQLFLGIRLECAKCHHHPFEKWSQGDFYRFAAYFGDVGRKGTGLSPPISGSEEIILETGNTKVVHPATGETLSPRPLFDLASVEDFSEEQTSEDQTRAKATIEGDALPQGSDDRPFFQKKASPPSKREVLAAWLTSRDNLFFAQVMVNRVWADLMGRGLVEPVDDLRTTNPPTNAELLDALAEDFQQSGYDIKHLIRRICNSYAYGLSSRPDANNVADRLNYSRHYRHRLRAETLIDSLDQITGVPSSYDALPPGSRAAEIWTHRTGSLFLDTFGRPNPNEDPPCERTSEFTVTQSLHLMNAEKIHGNLTAAAGTAAKLAESDQKPERLAEEIYLMIYSRFPTPDEIAFATRLLSGENESGENESGGQPDRPARSLKQRIEDLMWAMINTPEFSIQN